MLLRAKGHFETASDASDSLRGIASPLRKLRAVILLAGTVRANALRRAVGRFVLELPVDDERSVLDVWHAQLLGLADRLGMSRLPVRVIVDRSTSMPASNQWAGACEIRFEQDPFEFRGTGGLLCDLARQYEDDDYLLVANAPQILLEPLATLTEAMGAMEADVALSRQPDRTPSGLMLVRCGCLRAIPRVGFVDLNEQALPMIAPSHDVRICRHPHPTGLPMRTLGGYLEALRAYHRQLSGRFDTQGAMAEDFEAMFSVIEEGAQVDATAVIHDSVVLRGARVEAGAVLVRAVACPDSHIMPRQSAIDRLVLAPASMGKSAG